MWTCPFCYQEFIKKNQIHSCREKTIADFLNNKSAHTNELFHYFIEEYRSIGAVTVYPTKSMIAIGSRKRFAYVIQVGKNFIDVVFPFKQAYNDNLCFTKIKLVPGSNDYNHHFRMYLKEDLNEEVKNYMKLAFEQGV